MINDEDNNEEYDPYMDDPFFQSLINQAKIGDININDLKVKLEPTPYATKELALSNIELLMLKKLVNKKTYNSVRNNSACPICKIEFEEESMRYIITKHFPKTHEKYSGSLRLVTVCEDCIGRLIQNETK